MLKILSFRDYVCAILLTIEFNLVEVNLGEVIKLVNIHCIYMYILYLCFYMCFRVENPFYDNPGTK